MNSPDTILIYRNVPTFTKQLQIFKFDHLLTSKTKVDTGDPIGSKNHKNHIITTRNPPPSDALYGQPLMIITLSINMPKPMQVGVVLYAACCGTCVLGAGAAHCGMCQVVVAPCNQPSYLRQPPAPCRITHLDSVHRSHSTQRYINMGTLPLPLSPWHS